MSPAEYKSMIPTSFEALTEEEKDHILKTLIVLVFNTTPEEFPILRAYAKYGAQAFDNIVKVYEDKHKWVFRKKE